MMMDFNFNLVILLSTGDLMLIDHQCHGLQWISSYCKSCKTFFDVIADHSAHGELAKNDS